MLYKLTKLTNINGENLIENRLDFCKTFDINKDKIEVGKQFFIKCVVPKFGIHLITSDVKKVEESGKILILTSDDVIYHFE